MLDLTGQIIRGYEIHEKIGEGGYGAVYKAFQPTIKRDVAIKVILPEHADKPEFARRFTTEAETVARLEHPHIVPLYDYWHDEQGAFLVMRWLPMTLRSALKQQGALSMAQTARLLDQLGDALAVAHAAGIVHRDLKPDNILLDERGNAYLTDFGIAKQLNTDVRLTATDGIVGTPAYLSPEQIQTLSVTPQTDIYALGLLLYEMLTGEHPFAGTGVMLMINRHLQDPLPSVKSKRPDIPEMVDKVVQKATAKNQIERYADAPALADAFRTASNLTPGSPLVMAAPKRAAPVRHAPSSPAARNRYNMLQNVRAFWVEGVLENSLHGALIALDMRQQAGAVNTPWDTLLRKLDVADETLPPGIHVLDVFDKLNGKLLILGEPGSGKTTTLLEMTRDLLERAEADDEHPLPVVFNLSSWGSKRIPLTLWLTNELIGKYQVPKNVAQEWVANDQLLLLLDGLDEVAPEHREVCIEAINEYRKDHGFVDVVVCSRIADYEALTNRLKLNGAVTLQPLSDVQIDTYLAQIGPEMDIMRGLLVEDAAMREMGRSPLMLSIIALAYRGVSVRELPQFNTPEAQREHLFGFYVQRMYERRGGTQRYSLRQVNHYLAWLAQQMEQRILNIFFIEKLRPNWLSTPGQYRAYKMGVRLLYGAILLVAVLLLLSALPVGLAALLMIFLASGVLWRWVFIPDDTLLGIPFFETLRWSFKRSRVALGLAIGLALAYVGVPIFGVAAGLTLAVVLCLELESGHQVATRTQANQVLRASTINTGLVALAWGLAGAVTTGLGWGLMSGVTGGLAWGLAGGLLFGGGDALVKYFVLNIVLWLSGHIPRDYARFLDYATALVILRKAGGGYIFLHRYLLEYFAALEKDKK
jgi:hypothetical protein